VRRRSLCRRCGQWAWLLVDSGSGTCLLPTAWPLAASHSRSVLSREPETMRLASGEKATLRTASSLAAQAHPLEWQAQRVSKCNFRLWDVTRIVIAPARGNDAQRHQGADAGICPHH
jgi:hypothetical protein